MMSGIKSYSIIKKSVSLLLALSMLPLFGCAKKAETSSSSGSKQLTKVYIFNNCGATIMTPSKPEKLEAVKKVIQDEIGIDPVVTIAPANSDDAKQKLNVLLSSGEPVDIFWGSYQDYSSKNMIVPINTLLAQNGKDIKKNISNDIWAASTDKNNKTWGIPRFVPTVAYPIWIRADWLKNLNIPIPKTVAELESALKALKTADPAGNGSTITMLTDITSLRYGLAGAFTEYGNSNFKDTDGKIKPVQLAKGYKDFLSKMHDWYSAGLITKEAFAYKSAQEIEYIKQNKVAVSALWYSRVSLNQGYLNQNVPSADYQIAPITGTAGKSETVNPAGTTSCLFPAKSKNQAAAMKLMNWYFSDVEHYIVGMTGVKGEDWNYTDEKNHIFAKTNPKSTDYAGELNLGLGLFNERKAFQNDSTAIKHQNYLKNDIMNLSRAKKPFDFGITYDQTAINTAVPNYTDITRMQDEQEVKFITGQRPLSEFDKYLTELNSAGLQKYITEITQQYKQLKK